jgi:PKD repeat protein
MKTRNYTIESSYIKVVVATQKPVASFWGSRTSGLAPLAITFSDASTNTPTAWNRSFVDGTYSPVQKPKRIYSKAGPYSAKLTAVNAAGSGTLIRSNYIKVT